MPKAPRSSHGSHRFNPIDEFRDSSRLARHAVSGDRPQEVTGIERGDIYTMKRPQIVRISSDDGQIISDMEEIMDDDVEGSPECWDDQNVAREQEGIQRQTIPSEAYLLRVSIPTISPPRITRILRMPSHLTFHQFHGVIQEAFDWDNSHAYRFQIHEVGEDPLHGKTLDMPFPIRRDGEPPSGSERRRLCDVFGRAGEPMAAAHTFDFGDKWIHSIVFLGAADRALAGGIDLSSSQ